MVRKLILLVLLSLFMSSSCVSTSNTPTKTRNTDWPMYLHDSANRSSLATRGSLPRRLIWTRKPFAEASAQYDEELPTSTISGLMTNGNALYLFGEDGFLRSLSVDSGKEYRNYYPAHISIFGSPSPVTNGDQVLCGFSPGSITALDINTFTPVWKQSVPSSFITSTQLVVGGQDIYFGTNDGTLHAWSIRNGKKLWSKKLQGLSQESQLPCIAQGKVYQISGGGIDGSYHVYCLDQESGSIIWEVAAKGDPMQTPVMFSDNHLFYGSDESSKATIVCLDPANGKVIWTRDYPGSNIASPIASSGSILAAMNTVEETGQGRKWQLLSIDITGHSIGSVEGNGNVTTPVVASSKFASFATDNNEIYFINTHNMKVSKVLPVPGRNPFSIVLTKDKVLVGCEDGTIACFGN